MSDIYTVLVKSKYYWCELVVRADSRDEAVKKFSNFVARDLSCISQQEFQANCSCFLIAPRYFKGDKPSAEREVVKGRDDFTYRFDPADVEEVETVPGDRSFVTEDVEVLVAGDLEIVHV